MAPPPTQRCRWHAIADLATLCAEVCARTLACADDAIRRRGRFVIVLAGGNTPRRLYEALRSANADWSRWHVYFGDERCVSRSDPERNSLMAGSAWLDHVAIPEAQQHPMPSELGPAEAARRYAALLEPVGDFDLVLLGLGEDGHTGSLFPGHDLGQSARAPSTLAVLDAPKPPAERVTLSARRLSSTREAVFMVAGESKRDAVRRWRARDDIPARAITPGAGVDVFVEATLLSSRRS
ncbi:MAG: 6-phosphogluconolactonase [Pseudomonadota bacterium]|nr:6-phosphogluconolactonase [Pseudomonadota bacterium]